MVKIDDIIITLGYEKILKWDIDNKINRLNNIFNHQKIFKQ